MLRVVSHPLGPIPALSPRAGGWRERARCRTDRDARRRIGISTTPQARCARDHDGTATGIVRGTAVRRAQGARRCRPRSRPRTALAASRRSAVLDRGRRSRLRRSQQHELGRRIGRVDRLGAAAEIRRRTTTTDVRGTAAVAEMKRDFVALEAAIPAGAREMRRLAWLRRHYVAGQRCTRVRWRSGGSLLAPFGVLCFDPTHVAAKVAQAPLLIAALRRAGELDAALAALPDAGTGIAAGEGATLVFMTNAIGRDRLIVDGDGIRARRSGEQFTAPGD